MLHSLFGKNQIIMAKRKETTATAAPVVENAEGAVAAEQTGIQTQAEQTETVEQPENVEETEKVDETEQGNESEKVEETETVEQPESGAPAAEEPEKQKAKKTKKVEAVQVPEADIPANVKSVLQAFHNHKELYVDKFGAVFTKGTKPSIRGAAILYRNPYFK